MNFCDFYLFLKSNDTLVAMTLQSLVVGILLFNFRRGVNPDSLLALASLKRRNAYKHGGLRSW
jgi:hypothetical protein